MVRLSDDLAAVRRLYARPIATMPDIMVIDIAAPYRRPSLSIGRYYGIMVETETELRELDEFLGVDRTAAIAPALLDRRASALASDRITIATYAPPEPGWPWLVLCHWPMTHAAASLGLFARGAYTLEMFEDEAASIGHAGQLLASLARFRPVAVRMIAPDRHGTAGQA